MIETGAVVRLGDPFFVSFLPVFDVENDQMGLALGWQAPTGSLMTPPTTTTNTNTESFPKVVSQPGKPEISELLA